VQLAELVVPDSAHVGAGVNVPVLLVDRFTVPVGESVPGAMSETVTVQEVAMPTVTEDPHEMPVMVDVGLIVSGSQLLVATLLLALPL
jgi:hypothetical protein